MATLDIQSIKLLREETGAGVLDVKEALEAHNGDVEKAKADLIAKGLASAAKKAERVTNDGLVYSYLHGTYAGDNFGGKIGSLVYVACETDFVAKTEDFQKLCREIAMQAATEDYESAEALTAAEYIRDPSKTINDLIQTAIAKLGENIEIKGVARFSVR